MKFVDQRGPTIAIASSGLGHIRRGVETWAEELAFALHNRGANVHLFQGGGNVDAPWKTVLPCRRRFDAGTKRIVRLLQSAGGWRYGMGNGYEVEQTTFAARLWAHVGRDYDILHVKDPWVALWMDRLNRLGLSKPRVIISHGTEEKVSFLQKYSFLQHMAPPYVKDYEPHRPVRQANFMVPNFVNMAKFPQGDKDAARLAWNLPQDELVVVCVGAIRKFHKRIDYLIREFATFLRVSGVRATLVVAGAWEKETAEVIALGTQLLGDRVRFLENVPREKICSLYQAADIFVLTSLHEMFGNVFLEAMSVGLPVICNNTSVLNWVVGPAGLFPDLATEGALAQALEKMTVASVRSDLARNARPYVESHFSEPVVVNRILEMYSEVLSR